MKILLISLYLAGICYFGQTLKELMLSIISMNIIYGRSSIIGAIIGCAIGLILWPIFWTSRFLYGMFQLISLKDRT